MLRKYSVEMSGEVSEFDHDWRVDILFIVCVFV